MHMGLNWAASISAIAILGFVALADASEARWQSWSAHASQCSTTCGPGVRCRRRNCVSYSSADGGQTLNPDNCPGGEKASRDCLPCRSYVVCSQNGAWGWWSAWTECQLEEAADSKAPESPETGAWQEVGRRADSFIGKEARALGLPSKGESVELEEICGKGFRHRTRECNNPPPGPNGLLCGDKGTRDSEPCEVPCAPDLDIVDVIKSLLARDLSESPNHIYYVNYGAPATLNCTNEAYSLAMKGVKAYQDLQIQWRRNNESVTKLLSRREKLMMEKEEQLGLGSKASATKQETQLELAQVRSVGTWLTVDPVDSDHVGLYACYMVLDGDHYLMRSFTLLARQLPVRSYIESETVSMETNSETFVDPQLPQMESAQVLWYHNGLSNRQHMLVDRTERMWQLTLEHRHTGVWECYVVQDGKHWKTNEFQLSISDSASFIQKFDDDYITYFLACCALILYAVVGFPLAVITLRQREDNWVTAEEQRCIEYVRQINYLYMARYVRKTL